MAKGRTKKSKQQRRQAATARQQQRRQAQAQKQQAQESQIPAGPLSPGDRMNLMFGEIGKGLSQRPFAARAVALLVDYLLCGLLTMAPLMVAFQMASSQADTQSMRTLSDLYNAGVGKGSLALVLVGALFVSYLYYAVVPFKLLPGQTPGKYLTHLEIVMLDGSPATLPALSLRWAFMVFVETPLTFVSALVIQYVTLLGGDTVGNAYTAVGLVATALSAWRVWHHVPDRCAWHDLVAGTWVFVDTKRS